MRLVVAVLLLALAASGCGGSGDASSDPGPVHVHGLGVSPAGGDLYIATHTGLWRTPAGATVPERVGEKRHDLMGFSVIGPGHFLASGHPDLRDRRVLGAPSHLGLVESRDGGESWETVSLGGRADFHVLRAYGPRIVAVEATSGGLLTSTDGGRTWNGREAPDGLVDLVAQPGAPERLVATDEEGLRRSEDGGESWERAAGGTGLLAWPERTALYRVSPEGLVERSADGGRTFSGRGRVAGEPAALLAQDARTLYVALHDGSVQVSRDGGRTWTLRSAPP